MLQAMGHDTGVDLDRLLNVARGLPTIVGHEVPAQVSKAGPLWQLAPGAVPA
jgi:hydroxymethylglutaryl-CoA lyase